MGQKITETKKKYWRKKKTSAAPTRGMHETSSVFGGIWLRAALIRAVRTVAQTAIATIGTSAVLSDVNWKVVVSASVLSGILSILTAFAGLPEADQQMYIDTIEEVSDDE
jgi:hypothetical protein